MARIELILDTLIPADAELGMPAASRIGFDSYIQRYGIEDIVTRYGALADSLAQDKLARSFDSLDNEARLTILNASRSADIRLFSSFLTHVFRAYYSDRDVLERIGSGSVPPFPEGNPLDQDDWSCLEPVYERGQIFRDIGETN